MPHTKADFNLPDAIAGSKKVYDKILGGDVANDVLFYGFVDAVGYGGTFIPSSGPVVVTELVAPPPFDPEAAKAQVKATLDPLFAEPSQAKRAAMAGQIDWAKLAALFLQLLPFILPLLKQE